MIYPEYRLERINELLRYLEPGQVVMPEKIHRVTLFTTFRCNFACRYCKTIKRNPAYTSANQLREYTFPLFRRMLEQRIPHPIVHIHFTGGEATLVKDLPEMVGLAVEHGILCSLTSNGTAIPEFYRRLVENGLHEIRISCDAHIPEQFDAIVARRGAYHRVIQTIRDLVRLRDEEGKALYLILNMCVAPENRQYLVEFVKRSVSLNPNDVKLIPVAQESKHLGEFKEHQRILEELEAFLADFPEERFPLLRRKLKTVFAPNTWGFEDLASERLMAHCFVPLTERILDTTSYYPCPVYVREGGAPLGSLEEDDFETQQQKIHTFVRGESCLTDPICRPNCINCLKKFNLLANALISNQIRDKTGLTQPITNVITYPGLITHTEVFAMLKRLTEARRTFVEDVPYRAFLVIKPQGMAYRNQILAQLKAENIIVDKQVAIPDWNEVAINLYSVPLTEFKVFKGILMARTLPQIEGTASGELLLLKGDYSFEILENIKQAIRMRLPPSNYLILYQDDVFVTSQGYLHSPTHDHYGIEANILFNKDIGRKKTYENQSPTTI